MFWFNGLHIIGIQLLLQYELQNKWGIELDISRIDQLRRELNLTRIKPKIETVQAVKFAGIEIFSALVHHIGIVFTACVRDMTVLKYQLKKLTSSKINLTDVTHSVSK